MPHTPTLYTVLWHDPEAEDDAEGTPFGQMAIDADGLWSVESADDDDALDHMTRAATDLNGRDNVGLKRPGEGRGSLRIEEVARTDAGWPDAAREYLMRFWSLELLSAADREAEGVGDGGLM